MGRCPKLIHTVKGREKALSFVKKLTSLKSNSKYIYKLYHKYDNQPMNIYIETLIQPVVFELLLARILFEAAGIDESYALGQEEIATPILVDLYESKMVDSPKYHDEEFDLYYVWEKWCSLFNGVMELDVLNHTFLMGKLEKIIPIEK